MIKVHFLNEINLKNVVKLGSTGFEVKKVQEWINLWRFVDPTWKHIVAVDGDFGPQTDQIIRVFQEKFKLTVDGVVGSTTYHKLVEPMILAFTRIKDVQDYRARIVAYATQHLNNQPKELYNSNQGPWVRAYMDGNEGRDWAWCMGFVQTVLDQSFTGTNQMFTIIMPHTYSCDVVGFFGRQKNKLIDHEKLLNNPSVIQKGDVFLVRRTPMDWTHTGIVVKVDGKMIHTIEGNTNDEGSREGFEVCQRIRNLDRNILDVFKTDIVGV